MHRIRVIADPVLPVDKRDVAEVQAILRDRLPGIPVEEIDALPEALRDPLAHRLRATLLVADDVQGRLRGFALLSFAPDLGFAILDYVATGAKRQTSGVGGALYDAVREKARGLGARGLFFECLPDDPALCSDPALAPVNGARLRFYERFGARPIVGTDYERPLSPGQLDLPHLVYDDLGTGTPLDRGWVRAVMRAILERKYHHLCSPDYVDAVVESVVDDPVRLRELRWKRPGAQRVVHREAGLEDKIVVVVNDRHEIHHVRERGYVEAPVRVKSILAGLEPTGLVHRLEPRSFPESHLRAVHDDALVNYLKRVCAAMPEGRPVYPYVFPIRNVARPPKDLTYAAGYYCIDTFTPIDRNAFLAARRAVDCALTAADVVLDGQPIAYALVRPPGHHAERRVFGGFCYFDNAAIAANYLARAGTVAMVDVDYHHGNGHQDIFWERSDVLTLSIHGHPQVAYPFFTGFEDEIGAGAGLGFNQNLPLPEQVDGARYREALRKVVGRVRGFRPTFLVISLGLDTAKADPTGTWTLGPKDFQENGRMLGALGLPTLVVQEGGYRTASLGTNARAFFTGLAEAHGAARRDLVRARITGAGADRPQVGERGRRKGA